MITIYEADRTFEDIDNDDIVAYFNGKKIYDGDIIGLYDGIKDKVNGSIIANMITFIDEYTAGEVDYDADNSDEVVYLFCELVNSDYSENQFTPDNFGIADHGFDIFRKDDEA